VVGLHFLLSMALIAGAYAFWRETGDPAPAGTPGQARDAHRTRLPGPLRTLAWWVTAASAAVIALGVVVTGSGPHSGDRGAKRNGLDPEATAQVHADLVFLLLGLSVAIWFALRAVGAPPGAMRAAAVLVVVELTQGLIGFVQYLTHLPAALVAAHLLGAGLVWLATLDLLWQVRRVRPAAPGPSTGLPARDAGVAAPSRSADQGLTPVA
jgi:cytochrome c oxidase assembly protein subunit 15